MKLNELKKIIKQTVKEAIQEELKDILLEAVKSPKQIVEHSPIKAAVPTPSPTSPVMTKSKEEIRESYRNILGETAASFNTSQFNGPLKVSGTDTTSANGSLPEGNVSMDQIMGLMNSKG